MAVAKKSAAANAEETKVADPRRTAYTAAVKRLREESEERFQEILTEEYAKVGVKPRPTAAERQAKKDAEEKAKRDKALAKIEADRAKLNEQLNALAAKAEELEPPHVSEPAPEDDPQF